MESFCFDEAMRTVNRCLSNCSCDSREKKVVVLADGGFQNHHKVEKWLPAIKVGVVDSCSVVEKVEHYVKVEEVESYIQVEEDS